MLIVWALGLTWRSPRVFRQPWFIAKFALVVALTGYQGWISSYGKKLAKGMRRSRIAR